MTPKFYRQIGKQVPGFSDYFINKSGDVFSFAPRANRGRPESPVRKKAWFSRGYPSVSLAREGKDFKKYIHNLVLEAYIGPRPQGYQCRHLNGVKTDNRLENLKWGTRSENQLDRNDHGTGNRGEKHGMSKYTSDFVKNVRLMCKTMMQKDVALILGIPKSSVSAMNNYTWKWLK